MTDIGSIKPTNREVELKHPRTNEALEITLVLQSMFSKEVKAVQRRSTDRLLKLRAKGKSFSSEEIEANGVELMVAAIVDWRWESEKFALNGEFKPKFSEANLRELLKQDWIREQVDNELGDTASFF